MLQLAAYITYTNCYMHLINKHQAAGKKKKAVTFDLPGEDIWEISGVTLMHLINSLYTASVYLSSELLYVEQLVIISQRLRRGEPPCKVQKYAEIQFMGQ